MSAVTDFIALDVETANADLASICAIGLVHFKAGKVFKELTILVDPQDEFDPLNVSIHGICAEDVAGKPTLAQVFPAICASLENVIVVHHSHFDKTAIARAATKYASEALPCVWLDTLRVARRAWPHLDDGRGYGLSRLAAEFAIQFDHHDAAEDAKAAGLLMLRAMKDTRLGLEDWLKRVELTLSGQVPGRYVRAGDPSGPLAGETVVFTGKLEVLRRDAAEVAAKLGCNVSDNVNRQTTILVVGNQDIRRIKGFDKSTKHRKTEELIAKGASIRIVAESDFMRMVY